MIRAVRDNFKQQKQGKVTTARLDKEDNTAWVTYLQQELNINYNLFRESGQVAYLYEIQDIITEIIKNSGLSKETLTQVKDSLKSYGGYNKHIIAILPDETTTAPTETSEEETSATEAITPEEVNN